MDEVGKHPNLERRKAVYRVRMRCPKHLERDGIKLVRVMSLGTKERSIALERLPAARAELMAYFRGERVKHGAFGTSGIVSASPRLRRPDHPDIPLLRRDEAEALARQYFTAALDDLDLGTADVATMDREAMPPRYRTEWRK